MLHWVGDDVLDEQTEPFRLSTAQFRTLLLWLKGKNVVRLERWETERDFYALTIDDVPECFYQNAFPLLKEAGLPFTIFVNVSLLDTPGFISTDQLKEMAACPLCTVGSHGVNHGEFALLCKEQAATDLRQSREELERLIGKPVELFAYPYGSYYACGYAHKHLSAEVYRYAFGTVACPITHPSLLRPYFLPRINVDSQTIERL